MNVKRWLLVAGVAIAGVATVAGVDGGAGATAAPQPDETQIEVNLDQTYPVPSAKTDDDGPDDDDDDDVGDDEADDTNDTDGPNDPEDDPGESRSGGH